MKLDADFTPIFSFKRRKRAARIFLMVLHFHLIFLPPRQMQPASSLVQKSGQMLAWEDPEFLAFTHSLKMRTPQV